MFANLARRALAAAAVAGTLTLVIAGPASAKDHPAPDAPQQDCRTVAPRLLAVVDSIAAPVCIGVNVQDVSVLSD